MNNRHKRFKLYRTVIVEKFSHKHYIISANDYLWRLGIIIYIECKNDLNNFNFQNIFVTPKWNNRLSDLLQLYGVECLYELFHTFATNKKLKKLRHNPINPIIITDTHYFKGNIKTSDCHHYKYCHGIIDKNGLTRKILIKFNTLRALNQAGFDEAR